MKKYIQFILIFCIGLISCRFDDFLSKDLIKFIPTGKFEYSQEELGKGLDLLSYGEWWKNRKYTKKQGDYIKGLAFEKIARDKIIAFSLYTVHNRILKLSVQFYPLLKNEKRAVYLDLFLDNKWEKFGKTEIPELGWSALFRLENWNFDNKNIRYRVRHDKGSVLEGIIRRDPIDKEEIVVASLSWIYHRSQKFNQAIKNVITNLKVQDPDLLFFTGGKTFFYKEHTAGWLLFGSYFRDILKDYPSVILPDANDLGQDNLWGNGGDNQAKEINGITGGYHKTVAYINMVQRAQTSHLPDAYNLQNLKKKINTYYTSLNIGGIDFAILEDRKWKSPPLAIIGEDIKGKLNHIIDSSFDTTLFDKKGLSLLGNGQEKFLSYWGKNWKNAKMKAILSQTSFATLEYNSIDNKEKRSLIVHLDSNVWPQTPRKKVLCLFRSSLAVNISGDQYLMRLFHHGIDDWNDGSWSFVGPAIGHGIYERHWNFLKKTIKPVKNNLEYMGKFDDIFKNKITIYSYINKYDKKEVFQGGGYSLIRFNKGKREITFEAYPCFIPLKKTQFFNLSKTINQWENDGRLIVGYLPKIIVRGYDEPVIQVVEQSSNTVLYTVRLATNRFRLPVYKLDSKYTIRLGKNFPDLIKKTNLEIDKNENKKIKLSFKK